jgi:hypothetical protein
MPSISLLPRTRCTTAIATRFTVLREEHLRNIAFSVVHSQRKGYPPDTGAHVALRTIRRYLEHHGDQFDTIVLCMVEGEVNFGVYRNLLPLYFPRTDEEFAKARDALPADTGDDWGETQIAERQIRIDVAPIAVITDAGVLSAPAADSDSSTAATPRAAALAPRRLPRVALATSRPW